MKRVIGGILFFCLAAATAWAAMHGGEVISLIQAKGTVNTGEIGGKRLYVFSLWDKRKYSPVGPEGSFCTVISASRPQKLSLSDAEGATRALAIALPQDSARIAFDAKSTARAVLFQDPAWFKDSRTAEHYFRAMEDKKSFQALVLFFRKELPAKSLEELSRNVECVKLLENCSAEIFGENPAAIRASLEKAKTRLEELLRE